MFSLLLCPIIPQKIPVQRKRLERTVSYVGASRHHDILFISEPCLRTQIFSSQSENTGNDNEGNVEMKFVLYHGVPRGWLIGPPLLCAGADCGVLRSIKQLY